MSQPNPQPLSSDGSSDRLKHLEKRINQLNKKASQLLLFLSFALVVAAILETQGGELGSCQTMLLTFGMRFRVCAIFPILIGILPVIEIRECCEEWYNIVRWSKFALL